MNEKQETKKKKQAAAETPVHTIRSGAIAASIWKRQSPAGYTYLDYSLTRSFESLSSGSLGNSRNFFARNRRELLDVIDAATTWIDQYELRTSGGDRVAA